MKYTNMPATWIDDGIRENSCFPQTLTDDAGFALFTDDLWYIANINSRFYSGRTSYSKPPPASLTNGKTQPRSNPARKRWLEEPLLGDLDNIVVDEGNSTRQATDDELWDVHNVVRCRTRKCRSELQALGVDETELDDINIPIATATTQATYTPLTTLVPRVGSSPERLLQPTATGY